MAFKNVYSPWRSKYLKGEDSMESKDSIETCVFCDISKNIESTESSTKKKNKDYVIYADSICFAVMNLYPYTPGHFMIIPHKHIDSPTLLTKKEWLHISTLSQKAIKLLEIYGAQGVNMGINIKEVAGAGIPQHLHLHFVPRFQSDTNFITTIGETRIFGLDFDKIYEKILKLSKEVF